MSLAPRREVLGPYESGDVNCRHAYPVYAPFGDVAVNSSCIKPVRLARREA